MVSNTGIWGSPQVCKPVHGSTINALHRKIPEQEGGRRWSVVVVGTIILHCVHIWNPQRRKKRESRCRYNLKKCTRALIVGMFINSPRLEKVQTTAIASMGKNFAKSLDNGALFTMLPMNDGLTKNMSRKKERKNSRCIWQLK